MPKAYKLILASSLLLAVSMGVLLNSTKSPWGGVLYISAILFVFFSCVYSLMYYVIKKHDSYLYILVTSVCITAFLFFMDYMFWDNDPPNPPATQIVFESVVIGTGYVFLIWGVCSSLYYMFSKLYRVVVRQFN